MDKFNVYQEGINLDMFRAFCEEHGRAISFSKGEYFTRQGKVSRHWGFITKGHFAYTVIDSSGNEKIVGFAFQDTLVGDSISLIKEATSLTDIQAISDTEVITCDATDFRLLLNSDLNIRVGFAESLFEDIYTRYLRLHSLSPKERYLHIINECPEILQYISLKQLASYLMITPTYLSLIRKQLSIEK
ncbi:MAG: Crp/Fnr family transcriptional regulator [Muribaculaceae bacterium]